MSSVFTRCPSRRTAARGARLRLGLLLATWVCAAAAAAPPAAVIRTPAPANKPQQDAGAAPIDAALARQLAKGGKQDYVIEMSARADLSAAAGMEWQARGRYVMQQLRATADRSQAAVRRELGKQRIAFEPHWIKNVILVRGGDADSARTAAAQAGVARIRELPEAQIVQPTPGRALGPKADKAGVGLPPNISWIGADRAWAQGTRGHGVTVGIIDTGAFYTHHALRQQYRGWRGGDSYEHDYNWLYPNGGDSQAPVDVSAHGSHVIGTIAGDDHAADPAQRSRIGVAPGAQWIACLGLPVGGDSAFNLLTCGEFMIAPTRLDGSDPDPDQRPQVINNSWSEGNCDGEASSFYADVVDAWIAAGIFPVFAAGNASACRLSEPAGLSTVSSPAALAASFAVGSTGNHDGVYAPHSLWGPTTQVSAGLPTLPDPRGFPQLKPQVVAPGVDIVSVYLDGEDSYGTLSGTSMSSPHVAGLVALMLEAGECLTGDYAALGTMIMATSRPKPYASGGLPAPGPGDVPNYATGWGEIDAAAAVNAAAAACGPQGFVGGRITDSRGAAVGGARIELFVDENVRVWELRSEPDGRYIARLPENLGTGYHLRVTAYGHLTATDAGILVQADRTTPIDVALAIAPLAKIEGQVTDAATGWPLHARLIISGYPQGAVWTDPVSGGFSLRLPTGSNYRIDVDSDIRGYQPQTREIDVTNASTQDFALVADPVTCEAPGYTYTAQRLQQDFETAGVPAGWNAQSAGVGWEFGSHEQLNRAHWPVPFRAGHFAATIEPVATPNDASHDYLISPPIDLAGIAAPALRFSSYWNSVVTVGRAQVQVSTDDGLTWLPLGVPTRQARNWTQEAMSLAAHAGRSVRLRFHYDDRLEDAPEFPNPGWAIDDVSVVAGCTAPPRGSLIVGQVRDANTQAGLDGALVTVGDESTVSAQSADAGVGHGFFSLWSEPGAATVVATRGAQPAGYADAQSALAVGDGQTQWTTLSLTAGRLRLHPAAGPSASVQLGTVATVPFTLRNTGTQALRYGLEGVAVEEHFDDAFPPSGWEVSGDARCPWTLSSAVNTAGGDGRAAEISALGCFGSAGIDNRMQLAPLDLSDSQTASLAFFMSMFAPEASAPRFDVEVSSDGGASWVSILDKGFGLERDRLVELDLTPFVGHADVRVAFRFRAIPSFASVQVDQIHLFRRMGLDGPIAITPAAGQLAAGASIDTVARLDATQIAQPGTYAFDIRVVDDTPYGQTFGDVAGRMTVTPPPSWGVVTGLVRSLGRCEAQPAPLAGLPLRIVTAGGDEIQTRTDADGRYRYWLPASALPYTVNVAAEQHVDLARAVTVQAAAETVANLDLRVLAACLVPDPESLEVSLTAGSRTTRTFELLNLGPLAGDYTARVGGDPNLRTPVRVSQNSNAEPEPFATFGCGVPGGASLENHWYRVYPLADEGLAGTAAWLDGVYFGADSAVSSSGTQPVTVSVHALHGPMQRANLAPLASVTVDVADTSSKMLHARFATPVEVPLDETVVVEISVPDGRANQSTFYPAGNLAPARASAWWYAEDCQTDEPVTYDTLGTQIGAIAPIFDLDLRASDACGNATMPAPWLAITPAAGRVAADASAELQSDLDAGALARGTYFGSVCIAAPNRSDTDIVVAVRANVDAAPSAAVFADGFE